MVVTDLHGDWDAYQRYRDRFLFLFHQGLADHFVITGDLIHYYDLPEHDQSLRMVLDLLSLKHEMGERVIYLLGNHEVPHIYGFPLQKGPKLFTPQFERELGENRSAVEAFFHSLPFILRTRAGVSICHAGASDAVRNRRDWLRLRDFSHQALIDGALCRLTDARRQALRESIAERYGSAFTEVVKRHFSIVSSDDPRNDRILAGQLLVTTDPEFDFLWRLLFSRNELEYGIAAYEEMVQLFLESASVDFNRQRLLVSGHIDCVGGFTVVTRQHLRLASAKNAHPRETGRYLLFDTGATTESIDCLLEGLGSVWP